MGGKDLATCEQEREQAERSTGSSLDLSGSSDDDSGVGSGKDSGKGSGEGSGKGSDEVKDEDSDEVTDEDSDEVKDEDSDEVTDEDSDEEDSIGSEWSGGHTDQCKVDSDCVTKCESNPDFGGFSGTPGNAGGDGMDSSSPPPCSNDAGCKSLCEQMASQSGMSSAALGCDEVKCNLNTKTCSEPSYRGGFGGNSQPNFSGNSMQNFQGASGGRRLASSPDCKNVFCNSGMCQFKESNNWLSGSHEVSDEVSDEDSGKDPVQDTGSQSPDDPNDENTPSFNCLSREVWSKEKEEWCCTHENEGCKDHSNDGDEFDTMKLFEECLESGKDLATCEQEREQAERSTGSSLDLSGSSDDDSGVGSGKDSGKGSGEGSGKGSDEVKDEDSDEVTDEDSDEVTDEDSDE